MLLTKQIQSSLIREVSYQPEDKVLTVIFNKGGKYRYHSVGEDVYNELVNATSVGKYFHSFIKGRYETVNLGKAGE